ncbi:hypothetical protein [Flavobacterium anhuiense]|uniref:hypothetical protein n=1 Tax=Flavobacterium anhuiense TaxID=459526 RepID=UPI003D9962FF
MKISLLLTSFILLFSSSFYSQNKKGVLERKEGGITVVVYTKTDKNALKDQSGKVLLEDLRGMTNLGRGYQAIDSKNQLIYFTLEGGNVVSKPNAKEIKNYNMVCGTVPNYTASIKYTLDYFKITLFTDNSWINTKNTTEILGQISKNNADDCYFINGERTFSYSNYSEMNASLNIKNESPNAVIFRKDSLYGIFPKTKAIYSEVKITNYITKVKKGDLFGYYEINKTPKYKKLGDFEGIYARFELPDGRKGYLASSGHEYFDEQ